MRSFCNKKENPKLYTLCTTQDQMKNFPFPHLKEGIMKRGVTSKSWNLQSALFLHADISYKSCFHCRFTPFVFPGRFTSFFIRDILSPRPMNDDAPLKIMSSKHQGGEIDHLVIENSSNFVSKVFPIKTFRVKNGVQ